MEGKRIAGLFNTYEEYLESDMWKSKRDYLISLVGRCQICKSGSSLLVHHKTYENVGNEPQKDLQVLCMFCHGKLHGVQ